MAGRAPPPHLCVVNPPSRNTAASARGPAGAEALAACALSAVPGIGPRALLRLSGYFGSLRAAAAAGPAKILELSACGELRLEARAIRWLRRGPDLAAMGRRALQAARAAGARVVLLGEAGYPAALAQIEAPPQLLYLRGRLDDGGLRVAVVGSRTALDTDQIRAHALARDLARAGVGVVSGGARGIDRAAHEGALSAGGATAAVLGCGIDQTYPPEHRDLFGRIERAGGALISEFPPGMPGLRGNFPRRNRTLSGLSDAVVVLSASLASGALLTAAEARRQGRPVFAVPGEERDPLSAGPRSLLADGRAVPIRSAADVLFRLGRAPNPGSRHPRPSEGLPVAPDRSRPEGLLPALQEADGRLLSLLDERAPLHLDQLAARARVPAPEALRRLQSLELKGLCLQRPGKYYLRRGAL